MHEIDEDERREAVDERRRSRSGCKCGNPDWPGQCPGAANCPVHGEEEVCNACEAATAEPENEYADLRVILAALDRS